MADLTDQLGSAKINMTAVTGLTAGQGRFGAILMGQAVGCERIAKAFGIGLSQQRTSATPASVVCTDATSVPPAAHHGYNVFK